MENMGVYLKGSTGYYVTLAQRMLRTLGYDVGEAGTDGIFGTKTDKAVRKFQADCGIKVDGVIGLTTWNKLEEKLYEKGGRTVKSLLSKIEKLPEFKTLTELLQYG